MTRQKKIEGIKKILKIDDTSILCEVEFVDVKNGSGTVDLSAASVTLTMDILEHLARFLRTKSIDIENIAGSPTYSEWTPGSPGSCYLRWRDEGSWNPED